MEREDIRYLFSRYVNQLCTKEEYDRFLSLIAESENDEAIRELLDELWLELDEYQQPVEFVTPPVRETKQIRIWPRIAAAASVLLVLSVGGYWLLHKKQIVSNELAKNDIVPFSKQAILKTGHGKRLVLDTNNKGTLAQYAQTRILQTQGEQIAYSNNGESTIAVVYDTLQVPAGGKPYRLNFADGTWILVNVASAIRFPENFNGNKRDAELLRGEAFFSVVHNTKSPFTLKAKDQIIQDIGTAFNVNTYNDEPDGRTTLVSGVIKVNQKTLAPGQQAIVSPGKLAITTADIEETIAWTNGYFRFNGENIQAVMRELARWYNIEVSYEGKISTEGYYIKVARSKNISEVLKALERTNSVYFKIEGRRVTVLSKK